MHFLQQVQNYLTDHSFTREVNPRQAHGGVTDPALKARSQEQPGCFTVHTSSLEKRPYFQKCGRRCLVFPFAKSSTSLSPRQEQVSHFLCSGINWKLSSLSFFASLQVPFGNISLALLEAGSPKPSLFPCYYLLLRSAAALFHAAGQQAQAAPSICVCALKCYHGCLHGQGSKSEPWLSPYRVISATPVRTRGSFHSQTVCQSCTVIVPKASLHGGHSSLIGRCEQLTALGCWV